MFGVSGCQDASGWVQLVRKTGYCLTLPLTWLQYQWWLGGALGVSHPLADPPMDGHVYGGVLTNICPAQCDRQAPRAWRGVYSYLVLCTSPLLNTHDAFWGSTFILTTIPANSALYFDSSLDISLGSLKQKPVCWPLPPVSTENTHRHNVSGTGGRSNMIPETLRSGL